jgi:hypothetical protein
MRGLELWIVAVSMIEQVEEVSLELQTLRLRDKTALVDGKIDVL